MKTYKKNDSNPAGTYMCKVITMETMEQCLKSVQS